jgi:ABC-type Na+ transport system ATPase subunit NatA
MNQPIILDKGESLTAALLCQTACRALTMAVERGECFGLLGPNGAGKTTRCVRPTLLIIHSEIVVNGAYLICVVDCAVST